MSQLKAELEDVRKMVSDVVNRLINILERLQNLHAANPATMAKLDRLKAATEKLLASADDVSNELAGIEHEHQTPPSVGAPSGGPAPSTAKGPQNTVTAPKSTAGSGQPVSSAESSRSAYQKRIKNLYEQYQKAAENAETIWDNYLQKFQNDDGKNESISKPYEAYAAVEKN